MTPVASTSCYSIAVEPTKNRMFLQIIGFWREPGDVPDYHRDLGRAAGMLTPGFTLLVDALQMLPAATSVIPVHEEAQRLLLKAGLGRTAEVLPSTLMRIQARRIAESSGMVKAAFGTPEDAEAWLDGR